jgi:hypothetical protein
VSLLATAKVTRQVYIERIALRAAHGLLRITPTDSMDHYDEDYIDDEPIEPEHFKFLLEYSVKYTPVEPETGASFTMWLYQACFKLGQS